MDDSLNIDGKLGAGQGKVGTKGTAAVCFQTFFYWLTHVVRSVCFYTYILYILTLCKGFTMRVYLQWCTFGLAIVGVVTLLMALFYPQTTWGALHPCGNAEHIMCAGRLRMWALASLVDRRLIIRSGGFQINQLLMAAVLHRGETWGKERMKRLKSWKENAGLKGWKDICKQRNKEKGEEDGWKKRHHWLIPIVQWYKLL